MRLSFSIFLSREKGHFKAGTILRKKTLTDEHCAQLNYDNAVQSILIDFHNGGPAI
jgi:hypothetical protein